MNPLSVLPPPRPFYATTSRLPTCTTVIVTICLPHNETIAQRRRGCSLSRVRVNGVIIHLRPGGRTSSHFITGSTNFTASSFVCNDFTAVGYTDKARALPRPITVAADFADSKDLICTYRFNGNRGDFADSKDSRWSHRWKLWRARLDVCRCWDKYFKGRGEGR